MLVRVNSNNPDTATIARIVACLQLGGVIIYPTDTVYGLGCDVTNYKAVERLARIKGLDPNKSNFSFVCHDLSHITDYTKPLSNAAFRLMKKVLPGPYTFILESNIQSSKMFKNKRKTVGIRVPDNDICRAIVKELGRPIVSTSIHDEDELLDYTTDPAMIHQRFEDIVDMVVDGGYGNNIPSTVVDCTTDDFVILRQGLGEIDQYL